jgi:nucleotidyltransferase substrate binding protein (TIGR01987 family)
MNNDIRWKQRFQNFSNAYNTFCKTLNRHESAPDDEIVQMALVQAFEFTYELAWNVMKDYLESEGFDEVANAKQTIRIAFQAELITDAEKWMEMIQKRNLASHTYNQKILRETVQYIKDEFYPLVRKLYEDMKGRK